MAERHPSLNSFKPQYHSSQNSLPLCKKYIWRCGMKKTGLTKQLSLARNGREKKLLDIVSALKKKGIEANPILKVTINFLSEFKRQNLDVIPALENLLFQMKAQKEGIC
jgi:hypothetical protein